MNLSSMHKLLVASRTELREAGTSYSPVKNKRFTTVDKVWMLNNHATCTVKQAALHLKFPENSIAVKARELGFKFRKGRGKKL